MTLDELIPRYGEDNTELNGLKKIVADENSKIKELMKESKMDEATSGDWVAKITVKKSESFNDEKLLNIIKQLGLHNIIKTKEYVDMDAMEEAIYNGTITQDMLLEISKAREVKETVVLNVKKKKGEK